jgi:hypothetical protein
MTSTCADVQRFFRGYSSAGAQAAQCSFVAELAHFEPVA